MNRKCKFVGGNIKLGNIGTWSTLKGNEPIYIKSLGTSVVGSCGSHCDGCTKACYVNKSYRYPSVKLNHARNTIALRADRWKVFDDLNGQMNRKRVPFSVIRLNQSGEIECYDDFEMWCKLASIHPETIFYIYTKNYDVIHKAFENSIVPENMVINISIWHESGISDFIKLSKYPQIKAFVYVDNFKYPEIVQPETYCMAYDVNGKLNHNITCDKCKKCFSKFYNVIGCFDHS